MKNPTTIKLTREAHAHPLHPAALALCHMGLYECEFEFGIFTENKPNMDMLDIPFHLRQGGGGVSKELGHPQLTSNWLTQAFPGRPCTSSPPPPPLPLMGGNGASN